MTMHVIGAGTGRTGTLSLRLAINRLGLGPTYHMEDVLLSQPLRVPQWSAALDGRPDWSEIYQDFNSAVDWPTAAFFRELSKEYPSAKFVLTHRSPESWAASFGETIYTALAGKDKAPPEARDWLEMCTGVIARTGFPVGLDDNQLMKAYVAHNEAVKSTIPPNRLLVFEVKEGWEPLCQFLGTEVPDEPFPRTNNREEFWERVAGNT